MEVVVASVLLSVVVGVPRLVGHLSPVEASGGVVATALAAVVVEVEASVVEAHQVEVVAGEVGVEVVEGEEVEVEAVAVLVEPQASCCSCSRSHTSNLEDTFERRLPWLHPYARY